MRVLFWMPPKILDLIFIDIIKISRPFKAGRLEAPKVAGRDHHLGRAAGAGAGHAAIHAGAGGGC